MELGIQQTQRQPLGRDDKRRVQMQSGTDLNFSGLAQCVGLGSFGTNQTGAISAGLHLHSTLVVTTEGLPLAPDVEVPMPWITNQKDWLAEAAALLRQAGADVPKSFQRQRSNYGWRDLSTLTMPLKNVVRS